MTAKTELEEQVELEKWQFPADLQTFLDEDDTDDEAEGFYYYDDENNWLELRHKRGDMPGTVQSDLVDHLLQVLFWRYHQEEYGIYRELNFYQSGNPKEKPLYPDLALLKSHKRRKLLSYHLGVDGPAPDLIVEVLSTKTRRTDLYRKPHRYEKWGTREYFVYDPRERQPSKQEPRLWGWRMNSTGRYDPITAEADGRMWSEELNCWLVPDEAFLRLYDQEGRLLLNKEEAEKQRADRLAERLRKLGYDPDEDL